MEQHYQFHIYQASSKTINKFNLSFMLLCYREDAFLLVDLHFLLLHIMVKHIILGKETMRTFSLVWLLESFALVFITFKKSCSSLLLRYVGFVIC